MSCLKFVYYTLEHLNNISNTSYGLPQDVKANIWNLDLIREISEGVPPFPSVKLMVRVAKVEPRFIM